MSRASGSWRNSTIGILMLLLCGIAAGCGGGASSSPGTGNPGGTLKAPGGLSYGEARTFDVGRAIDLLVPSVTGTVTRYSVTPSLPPGLVLNTTTGVISGTPSAARDTSFYTLTASNSAGSTATTLSITVIEVAPSDLSYASPALLNVGGGILPLAPSVTGWVAGYGVEPALPPGLTLDPQSGVISGTPSAALPDAVYRITASNGAGSAQFDLTIGVMGLEVLSGAISRTVVEGTTIAVAVRVRPLHFTLSGPLYARAAGNGVFEPGVAVADNGDGSFSLTLETRVDVPAAHYADFVALDLCSDPGCTSTQTLPSAALLYDINVMTAESPWPGDNPTELEAWEGVADWTLFQGNAAHTGFVPVELEPDRFSTRYVWEQPVVMEGFAENPADIAVEDGRVFTTGAGRLYALSEHDGSQLWSQDFLAMDRFPDSPAVANGVVYMAAGIWERAALFAFDTQDGSEVFSSPITAKAEHNTAPTIGPDGIYLNASTSGDLYAFDRSGQLLFSSPSSIAQTGWTPAVDDSGVYVYSGNFLKVVDPVTGTPTHMIFDGAVNYGYGPLRSAPVLGAPGSVFAVNYWDTTVQFFQPPNQLYHFDLADDRIDWQVSGSYRYTPAYGKGILYVSNEWGGLRLEGREESSGDLVWNWTAPHSNDLRIMSEPLLTENLIFVSTNVATYAVDLATARTVWSFPAGGNLALSRNGVLYIQSEPGFVAINLK